MIVIFKSKNGFKNGSTFKTHSRSNQKNWGQYALELTYSLAVEYAGIIYQTFNEWMHTGQTEKSGKYYQFYQYVQKCNAGGDRKLLERLNDAAAAENFASPNNSLNFCSDNFTLFIVCFTPIKSLFPFHMPASLLCFL